MWGNFMLYHYSLLSRVGWIESLTMLKELFKNDVVVGLAPLFYKEPEIKIYAVVNVVFTSFVWLPIYTKCGIV